MWGEELVYFWIDERSKKCLRSEGRCERENRREEPESIRENRWIKTRGEIL